MDDEPGQDPETGLRAARLLGDAGNYRAAAGQLRRVLADHPGDASCLSLLGLYLDYLGDRTGALDACRAAVAARPEDADAHRLLGLVLGRGRAGHRAALVHHREAVRLDPENGHNHYQLACLLCRMYRTRQARRALREACERAPADPVVLGGAATILFAAGRAREAEGLAARAYAAGPDSVVALAAQARARLLAGRGGEAYDLARAAVAVDASYVPAIDILVEADLGRRRVLVPWMRVRGWIARGRLRGAAFIYCASALFAGMIAASQSAGPIGSEAVLGLGALAGLYVLLPGFVLRRQIAAAHRPLRLRKTF